MVNSVVQFIVFGAIQNFQSSDDNNRNCVHTVHI